MMLPSRDSRGINGSVCESLVCYLFFKNMSLA